jgi:hypothetical protein
VSPDDADPERQAFAFRASTAHGPRIEKLAERLERLNFTRDELSSAGRSTAVLDVQIERAERQLDELTAAVPGWRR